MSDLSTGPYDPTSTPVEDLLAPLPILDASAPNLTPPAATGRLHLHVVVLFAYHREHLKADCTVVSSLADCEANALLGASDHNRVVHPDSEWTGHQEHATQVPDALIQQVAQQIVPTAIRQAPVYDPFAGIPGMFASQAAPGLQPITDILPVDPALVPSFPQPECAPPPQPKYLVVAAHPDRTQFRLG